jgi:hypothetical protein
VVVGIVAGLVAVLLVFGALLWVSRSVEDAVDRDPLTTSELSDRFIEIPGWTYREPTASEQQDFERGAGSDFERFGGAVEFRFLERIGNESIIVLMMGAHPQSAQESGFEKAFAQGFGSGFSGSNSGFEEIDIAGETAFHGTAGNTSWITLVDEEDGVIIALIGTPSTSHRVAEDFAESF